MSHYNSSFWAKPTLAENTAAPDRVQFWNSVESVLPSQIRAANAAKPVVSAQYFCGVVFSGSYSLINLPKDLTPDQFDDYIAKSYTTEQCQEKAVSYLEAAANNGHHKAAELLADIQKSDQDANQLTPPPVLVY